VVVPDRYGATHQNSLELKVNRELQFALVMPALWGVLNAGMGEAGTECDEVFPGSKHQLRFDAVAETADSTDWTSQFAR
jgi:hypothetical protein